MALTWVAIVNACLKWLTTPLKFVLFVAIVATAVIWNPFGWQQYTHSDWFFTPHLWIAWLVFGITGLWLVFCFLFWIVERAIKRTQVAAAKYRFRKIFRDMPADQARAMLAYIDSGKATHTFLEGDAAIRDLIEKNIVTHAGALYDNWLDRWSYTLTPEAIEVLRERSIQQSLRLKVQRDEVINKLRAI